MCCSRGEKANRFDSFNDESAYVVAIKRMSPHLQTRHGSLKSYGMTRDYIHYDNQIDFLLNGNEKISEAFEYKTSEANAYLIVEPVLTFLCD